MPSNDGKCISKEEIQLFVLCKTNRDETIRISEHLASCEQCLAAMHSTEKAEYGLVNKLLFLYSSPTLTSAEQKFLQPALEKIQQIPTNLRS